MDRTESLSPEMQFATFQVNGLCFGVELCCVQELIRFQDMTRVPLSACSVRGLINLRGQIVIAVDARRALGLPDRPVEIDFALDGIVLDANENFLATVGYALSEIQGRHHRMFVQPAYRESAEYKHFWQRLNEGEYLTDEYMRIGKGGPRGLDPGQLQPYVQ